MSWADAEGGGYQLEKDGQVLAHVFSIGNLWLCNLRVAKGVISNAEPGPAEAKAWAEQQLNNNGGIR
jgi:hypothetical protein